MLTEAILAWPILTEETKAKFKSLHSYIKNWKLINNKFKVNLILKFKI